MVWRGPLCGLLAHHHQIGLPVVRPRTARESCVPGRERGSDPSRPWAAVPGQLSQRELGNPLVRSGWCSRHGGLRTLVSAPRGPEPWHGWLFLCQETRSSGPGWGVGGVLFCFALSTSHQNDDSTSGMKNVESMSKNQATRPTQLAVTAD